MKYLATVFWVSILAGCAGLPASDGMGEGRLVIWSDFKREIPGGPWWDYQIWAKHHDTGEKVIIHIDVSHAMKFSYSRSLAPGYYDIYEWNSISKEEKPRLTIDHDIVGSFIIKPNTLTMYDHKLTVTIKGDSQSFAFDPLAFMYKDIFESELKDSEKNIESWDLYWSKTRAVILSN